MNVRVAAGEACAAYHDEHVRNLRKTRRMQADETWSFCYAKQKNVKHAKAAPPEAGDTWTWLAMDADHKLVISWAIGPRDLGTAYGLMVDPLPGCVELPSHVGGSMRSIRPSTPVIPMPVPTIDTTIVMLSFMRFPRYHGSTNRSSRVPPEMRTRVRDRLLRRHLDGRHGRARVCDQLPHGPVGAGALSRAATAARSSSRCTARMAITPAVTTASV